MKKKFKKIIASITLATFAIGATCPAYATSEIKVNKDLESYNLQHYSDSEQFLLSLSNSENDEFVVTFEKLENGTTLYNYVNGELTEIVNVYPEKGYYEYATPSNYLKMNSMEWTRVDCEKDTIYTSSRALINPTIRELGYMHYLNPLTYELSSIQCHVKEWPLTDTTVPVDGSWTSVARFTAFLMGSLGITHEDVIVRVIGTLAAATLIYIAGNVLVASTRFDLAATDIRQEIIGLSTTHSNLPQANLGEAHIYYFSTDSPLYAGEYDYKGYTTHLWRTGTLGSKMFFEVYGIEHVPTSWSSEP